MMRRHGEAVYENQISYSTKTGQKSLNANFSDNFVELELPYSEEDKICVANKKVTQCSLRQHIY